MNAMSLILVLLLLPANLFASSGDEKALSFSGLAYPLKLSADPARGGGPQQSTPFSAAPAEAYDTVLLQGLMPEPGMRLGIETADATCRLDGFRRFPNGRFWARCRTAAPVRSPVRLSVEAAGLRAPASLTIYGTELFIWRRTREAPRISTAPYVPAPSLSVPDDVPFHIVRRAQWSASPPSEPYTPDVPRYFTLHHTQAHYPKTYQDAVQEMRFIQDYHQNGHGWIDIGYHFLIDPMGDVFEGRPIRATGAHVLHYNDGNIGISIMGNYHPPADDKFTQAAQDSFVTLGRYLKDTYSVQSSSFYAHRDLEATDCPGDDLYARKELLRSLIFSPQPLPVVVAQSPDPLNPAQSHSLRQLLLYLGGE